LQSTNAVHRKPALPQCQDGLVQQFQLFGRGGMGRSSILNSRLSSTNEMAAAPSAPLLAVIVFADAWHHQQCENGVARNVPVVIRQNSVRPRIQEFTRHAAYFRLGYK
jgi:hypothetical protein